jgi:hypothetical protein
LNSNNDAEDLAPDSGAAAYDLDLKPVLDSLVAHSSPTKPKHGKPFRLTGTTLRVEDGTIVKADSITCVAKLNGKRLAGRCSWRVPANARGKRLVVTLTARYKARRRPSPLAFPRRLERSVLLGRLGRCGLGRLTDANGREPHQRCAHAQHEQQ